MALYPNKHLHFPVQVQSVIPLTSSPLLLLYVWGVQPNDFIATLLHHFGKQNESPLTTINKHQKKYEKVVWCNLSSQLNISALAKRPIGWILSLLPAGNSSPVGTAWRCHTQFLVENTDISRIRAYGQKNLAELANSQSTTGCRIVLLVSQSDTNQKWRSHIKWHRAFPIWRVWNDWHWELFEHDFPFSLHFSFPHLLWGTKVAAGVSWV